MTLLNIFSFLIVVMPLAYLIREVNKYDRERTNR